jgi:hypothetical protein
MKVRHWFLALAAAFSLQVFATTDLDSEYLLDSVLSVPVMEPDTDVDLYAVRTLARLTAGPQLRRLSVRVRNCGNDISQVKLIISKNPLIVRGVGVMFKDGTVNSFGYSRTFPAGYQSSWISLSTFRRRGKCVTGVFVNARSGNPKSVSRIQVLGR